MYTKNKKLTVTIGIPTYNEERNIGNLLIHLLNQKQKTIKITKIHIVDDNSSDKTVKIIRKCKDKHIILLRREKRLGQVSAQNIIFSKANTDVVLLLEADTFPTKNNYVEKMVECIRKDTKIGLIQGNMIPLKAKTWLGDLLNTQFNIFTKFVIHNKEFESPICSGRGGRLFAKFVYKKLRWPTDVPDDDYANLWCVKQKIKRAFQAKASCYYQRPQVLEDYLKERRKINGVESSIKKHFPKRVVNHFFHVPMKTQISMSIYFFLRYPLKFFLYIGLLSLEKLVVGKSSYTDFWPRTKTTYISL